MWCLRLAILFVLLFAFPAFAQDVGGTDPILTMITGLLASLGIGGKWATIAVVVIASVRALAATISKYVADDTLGTWAPIINKLGGNERHAGNAE